MSQISRARTFGFMRDIEYLQSKGLCLGGNFDCLSWLMTIVSSTMMVYV